MSLKTLGELFSDQDNINKNRSSIDFLNFALKKIKQNKIVINNIDLTVVCEKIILKNYLDDIKKNLIKLIGVKNITIKATRFENKHHKYIECNCVLTIK